MPCLTKACNPGSALALSACFPFLGSFLRVLLCTRSYDIRLDTTHTHTRPRPRYERWRLGDGAVRFEILTRGGEDATKTI
eukprot:scaffold36300_cov123-Isochrysis_galbana.AAC.6